MTIPPIAGKPAVPVPKDAALMSAARDLEVTFLAQMLTSAGLGKTYSAFGGGVGEDQFASFLVEEQARKIVDQGGIGLAESLFEALKERRNVT